MKKIISICMLALCAGVFTSASAQVKDEVKKDAKKVGNKTAELASKGKSKVTDKTYADKVGPGGETIYIDKHSKYYYVDAKGHHQYVKKAELKDK
jgi:hypothetical protein